MNMKPEIIELRGSFGQLVEQGPGEVTLGELVPVEGATAEMVIAYLPSCAATWETLNFHLDFKNTSPVPVSIRPVIYFIREPEAPYRAFGRDDGVILQPGQSYHDYKGSYWLGGIMAWGTLVIQRVEAAIEVYTPEGWVEADRVAGEPFEWWDTLPLPIVTITQAPQYADPGQEVTINFEIFNPGYTNHPSSWYEVNGVKYPPTGYWWHPPDTSLSHSYSFIMSGIERTITITPYRWAAPGATAYPGEPVSVTIYSVPLYRLDISINGEGLVLPEDVSGNYPEGTVIELTAYPAPGWFFHSWEGTDNNSLNPTTVTMDSDKQVVCNFTQVAPAGCLPAVGAGILLVAGIIAAIILLV